MRTLDWEAVDDILVGATVYGCGGGGELAEGRAFLRPVYDEGRAVTLAAPDELHGDALVACPYGVGGMVPGDEGFYGDRPPAAEHPGALAVRAIASFVGREVGAIITGELGGTSIADVFVPAALLGLPVVDADPVGRAVPELQHSLFFIHGVKLTPQAVVNEIGDTVLVTRVADGLRAEALVRALAVASRNLVWVADHAGPWEGIRDVVLRGAISGAERMGIALREARTAGADAAAAVAAAGGGRVLFRGAIVANDWSDHGGFTHGQMAFEGRGEDAGGSYRIWYRNENLGAGRGDAPQVTAPDLIVVIGPDGMPVTNPFARVGDEVTVVGLPAAPAWRTARGIEVLGPRALGFDVDYVPLEDSSAV